MKKTVFLLLIFLVFTNCAGDENAEKPKDQIEDQVQKAYNKMFKSYAEGTDDFFEYYEDDFVRVESDGSIHTGIDQPKKDWNRFLKTHKVELLNYEEDPKMVIGSDQVVTIGKFKELFIEKKSQDTTRNTGVYISSWRKQPDGKWKISMDTFHAGL
ncbi:hypothetical protein C7S20_04815 [Christiangramia fulva]|uniref:DUF4440 domain-containing protein n=1 Tax=Christiangramia fulva TaxID=2126553 RepID=A0A2R3Z303_9FLAO|nr:hypothetical protein [Christiangramia fulva]AVR44636.1 hypothetical protein C7S20_04815 [Christiangramia fulva]